LGPFNQPIVRPSLLVDAPNISKIDIFKHRRAGGQSDKGSAARAVKNGERDF